MDINIGDRFSFLTVIGKEPHKPYTKDLYICKCDCGNITRKTKYVLEHGIVKTCGDEDCEYHKGLIIRNLSSYNEGRVPLGNKYDLTKEYGIGYTSSGIEFYFDLDDYDLIKNYTWYEKQGYIRSNTNKTHTALHRLIMNAPKDKDVDHINHNKRDCRKENLRIVTNSQNQMNKDINTNNTSGYRGISWHKKHNKWIAQIGVNGKLKYLGIYTNLQDAIQARKKAEEEYFGEYNFNPNLVTQ